MTGGRGKARPAVFDCLFDDPVGVLTQIFVVERFELFEQFDFLFAADFVSSFLLHGDEGVPQFEVYPRRSYGGGSSPGGFQPLPPPSSVREVSLLCPGLHLQRVCRKNWSSVCCRRCR